MRAQFSIATTLLLLVAAPPEARAQYQVDYSYPPGRWFTPIGLVDDWQKSLVDEQGRLAYDFGPGPYAQPKTRISVGPVGANGSTASQSFVDARVPIVNTDHTSGSLRWRQSAFAVVPDSIQQPSTISNDGAYRRRGGFVGSVAWAPPQPNVDPAFRSVAWGTGRAIYYDLRVPTGASRRVALGFLEVYRSGRILRVMDLTVEGAETQTVDLVATGGQNVPQVFFFEGRDTDGDGWIEVGVMGSTRTQDPNVFVSGIWMFADGSDVTAADVVAGRGRETAELHINSGTEVRDQRLARMDLMRTRVDDPGADLQVRIETLRPLSADLDQATLLFEGRPFIMTRPGFVRADETADGWLLSFPAGTSRVDVLAIHGRPDGAVAFPDVSVEQRRATTYWRDAALPWDRITVPDHQIQDLLDGGIRTTYQVREVVDGYAQFQPGATVYRGLWFGDGAWAVETTALLDDPEAAREMLDAMLAHQSADGKTGVMKPALLHRETAHLIYAVSQYVRLHRDWAWLEGRWGQFERAVQYVIELRRRASTDPSALYYGLMPPGYTDGGIGGVGASYGSIYWGLIALGEASKTARALGHPIAAAWETEYQDFLAAFRRAALRDQQRDEAGNLFLPIKMNFDAGSDLPQRGQWGLLHAVAVGRFVTEEDPLAWGTLAMLNARTEQGLVVSTGWLTNGLWPVFAAHRAIAHNWLRDSQKSEELLYAFANHATPTLLWAEEQLPKGAGANIAGDVPHTVANMQVARLLRYMLVLERGDDLEVLDGLPQSWLRPGARLLMESMPTFFGPTTVKVELNSDGNAGTVWVQTPAPENPEGVVRLSLRTLIAAGFVDASGNPLPDEIHVAWDNTFALDFARRP